MDGVALPGTAPWALITAGASALGVLLLLIRGLTWSESAFGASAGIGWSGWLIIIAGAVLAAATIIPLTSAAGSVEQKLNKIVPRSGD